MTAVHAFEHGFGIEIDPAVRALRRLLYCGEWIESHALHVYLLHLPDFLGYASALELARDHRSAVESGLTLKKAGNRLVELIGGRAIHPVSVRVGGFSRAFRRERDHRPPRPADRGAHHRPRHGRAGGRPRHAGVRARAAASWRCATRPNTR